MPPTVNHSYKTPGMNPFMLFLTITPLNPVTTSHTSLFSLENYFYPKKTWKTFKYKICNTELLNLEPFYLLQPIYDLIIITNTDL